MAFSPDNPNVFLALATHTPKDLIWLRKKGVDGDACGGPQLPNPAFVTQNTVSTPTGS
jgi:hypothetical protein